MRGASAWLKLDLVVDGPNWWQARQLVRKYVLVCVEDWPCEGVEWWCGPGGGGGDEHVVVLGALLEIFFRLLERVQCGNLGVGLRQCYGWPEALMVTSPVRQLMVGL